MNANYTGDSGYERAKALLDQQEAERAARRETPMQPFRFFCPVGEEREIVVVDDRPSFFRHEHCMQDRRSKRWDVFLPCLDEVCNCPACAVSGSQRPAYFAMYLTVIDFTGYEDSRGDWHDFSKKLLVVKSTQQKKLMRYYEREGTMRGMSLIMVRNGEKEANIGDPEFNGFMSEEELETYVSQYTDKEGEVHEVLCYEPYAYEAIFPPMDEEQLRALVGGEGSTGSRAADDRALGRSRRADNYDDAGTDDNGWGAQGGRRVATRRAASAPPADEQDDVAPQPARRTARPAPAAPARPVPRRPAPARQAIDPADLPDAGTEYEAGVGAEEPPFEPDEPVQRTARPAPVRRAAPEPQAAAASPRGNMAARRASLRR